jgi:MFS family permease
MDVMCGVSGAHSIPKLCPVELVLTVLQIIVTDMVSLHERGKFVGFLQLFGAVGLVAGMLLASVLETKASWRW